jgi:septal ring factor EnvC (AmiA/AmiB activator)
MLLGLTEFTKLYIQIKDNNDTWAFVNLVRLVHNSGISGDDVVELLRIANGHLPRVRLEFDRLKQEKSSLQSEINSLEAEKRNSVRTYQDFCDRNLKLKKREVELQLTINELEDKATELQEKLNKPISELQALTEDEKPYYRPKVEPLSRTIIFDTRNLS